MTIAPNESLSRLPKGFLGNLIQVCVVSPDYKATIRRMQQAGICDCSAFTFDSRSCTDLSYYGKPADLSMKVCFGSAGTMTWEVIQPLRGPTIHQDFLARHGEGIQYVAFDCNNLTWNEKLAGFNAAGFEMIQSGRWLNQTPWGYLGTEDRAGTTIEIWNNPPDWQRPKPYEVFD